MSQIKDLQNIFIVGAQRSGTTYLYSIFDKHPQICLAKPVRPEPKFFLHPDEIAKGKDYYLDKYYTECNDNTRILIEKSTSYIESIEAGLQIKKMFPKSKALVILRNPVERALSNYFFSANNGLEKRSVEDAFLHNKPIPKNQVSTSVSPFNYIGRGEYIKYIEDYLNIFKKEELGIFIFDEIKNNPSKINEILSFIGVDIFNHKIPDEIYQPVNQSKRDSEINIEVKSFLQKHYAPFNKQLEDLLGRNIDVWK